MRKLWRRLYFLLNRNRLERELADEMEAHREMMPPDRRARFGSSLRLREESRDIWIWTWLDQAWQDLCYGARVLSRAPGFTLGATAVLALGIGVNLAEFQIFDAMIFHRHHFRDAAVTLQFYRDSRHGRQLGFPAAAIDFYREKNRSLAWLVSEEYTYDVVVEGVPGLRSNLVSSNYFTSLGLVPAAGRLLDAHDSDPGAPPVAVLGHQYWRDHWGADPHVVGRVIHVYNHPVVVVGVAPLDFDGLFSKSTSVWMPSALRSQIMTGLPSVHGDFTRASQSLFGKPKPGVSQVAVEAELTALTQELARIQPHHFGEDERIAAEAIQQPIWRSVRLFAPVAIFMTMILLVLLSACANLGNMLLARGLARQREIAIRISIGAGRGRVLRQLMTENLLLAILGSIAGLAFAGAAARLLLNRLGAPTDFRLTVSAPLLVFGVILTLVSVAAFGLPAAWQTIRPDPKKVRLRQGLIGVQVAISCLLLIASGILAHQGIETASAVVMFDYANMLVVHPQVGESRATTAAAAQQRLDELAGRMRALPGVAGVTAALVPPLGFRLVIDSPPGLPHISRNAVAPSYFDVMQLPVLRGRTFAPGERDAVVVSESAARAIWPAQEPLGKTLTLGGSDRTVVGVSRDSGANLLVDFGSVEAYLPMAGPDTEQSSLILHVRGDPGPLVRLIPGAAAAVNDTVEITLLRDSRDRYLEGQRRMITLIGSIGGVATVLAAAGMFALVAFAVAQRRREFGIRMAIGARPRHILGVLLRQNARPTAIGMIVGVGLAIAVARLLGSLVLIRNRPIMDIAGFAGGLLAFAVVAALATVSPALRALRIDPSTTLREE